MEELDNSYRELAEEVQKKLGIPEGRLYAELQRISVIANNTRQLTGKRVLDIGCGSVRSLDYGGRIMQLIARLCMKHDKSTMYHPWYCRILQEAGAHPVGLDIVSNKGETFENYKRDISDPKAFADFENESFDAANNYRCTVPRKGIHARLGTSPALYFHIRRKNRKKHRRKAIRNAIPPPEWETFMYKQAISQCSEINDMVFHEVARLLREGGTYTLAEFVFRKQNGILQEEGVLQGLG